MVWAFENMDLGSVPSRRLKPTASAQAYSSACSLRYNLCESKGSAVVNPTSSNPSRKASAMMDCLLSMSLYLAYNLTRLQPIHDQTGLLEIRQTRSSS